MSDLIEIFVTETNEEVTLNVTPNLIEVNIIKGVSPSNPITGIGTTNYLPKFTGASTIGNSQIFDNGTNVGIGTTSPSNLLEAVGSAFAQIRASNFATTGTNRGGGFRATSTTNGGTSLLGDFNAISNNANAPYNGVDGVYVGSRTAGFPLSFTVNNAGTEILALNIASTGAATFSSSVTARGFIRTATTDLVLGSTGSYLRANLGATTGNTFGYIDVLTNGENAFGNLALAPFGGNVSIGTASATSKLQVVGLTEYATNALAIAAGLTVGAFYHTAGILKVVI